MLNPPNIVFLGLVREKELLEAGVNLLISQTAVVIGQTGQSDRRIGMTELGPSAWLKDLVVSSCVIIVFMLASIRA